MSLSPGTAVSVNIEGMDVGGIPCGLGTSTAGSIVSVEGDVYTVELAEPFGGQSVVTVGGERLKRRYGD